MREYFDFSGRLNRKPYWLRQLAIYAIMFVALAGPVIVIGGTGPPGEGGMGVVRGTLLVLGIAVFLVCIVAVVALHIRRLHDRNKSGWWLLFFTVFPNLVEQGLAASGDRALILVGIAISIAISIWFLVEMGCLRGTRGPNRFGPDPLTGPAVADIFA